MITRCGSAIFTGTVNWFTVLPPTRQGWSVGGSRPEVGVALDVEAKMNDIAVLNHVFLALQAPATGVFCALFTIVGDEVFITDARSEVRRVGKGVLSERVTSV